MQQAISTFLDDLRLQGRSARTITGHHYELLRLSRHLDERQIDYTAATAADLRAYARLRSHRGYSSRANMICSLRVFYAWLVAEDILTSSPATGLKTPTRPRPVPRALTRDQIRCLVDDLDRQADTGRGPHRDRALLLTALYAGLRAAELAALTWSAIDDAGAIITIRLSKMNHGRSIPIHPELSRILATWRTIQAGASSWPVFSMDGHPFSPNRVGKIARRYARRLDLPLTAHVLRHTFATWSLRNSGRLYAVSQALGHSQVTQTQIYLSATIDDLRPAVNALPDLAKW